MPEILSIKNVTVSHSFVIDGGGVKPPGLFYQTITSYPIHPVDEIVIRAINWNGEAADTFLYLLWSNITNDIIASFCGGSINPHFPGIRIMPTHPMPNVLVFKLMYARSMNDAPPKFADEVVGDIAIHFDLISYKKHRIA